MPYQDYGSFGKSYFEEANVSNPHGAGYTDYSDKSLIYPRDAAKVMKNKLSSLGVDPSKIKVLVVGCAYGYEVEYLVNLGVDAYGMDISTHAVNKASQVTSVGDRIYEGDVTVLSDIQNVARSTQGGKFDVIISSAVLCCLTDSEAQTACDNMRSEAKHGVIHRCWATDGSDLDTSEYNAKTLSEWKSLCDPNGDDLWTTEWEYNPYR